VAVVAVTASDVEVLQAVSGDELGRLVAQCLALSAENEQLWGEVTRLAGENERLRARVGKLEGQLEDARRASKRQAAPFSRGSRSRLPVGRGAGRERSTACTATASRPGRLMRSSTRR
jgi:hypothetical protein